MPLTFSFAVELTRHVVGAVVGGPVEVWRAEIDLLSAGDPLVVGGLAGNFVYRGPVSADGVQLGFGVADAGRLVLLCDAAPAVGTEIVVGDKAERLIGVLAGTLVTTPAGERAVESLGVGDLVCLVGGAAEAVRRVGVRRASAVFSDPLHAQAVRICAGALGEGVPRRDLRVSADLALLLGGVLVQAGALVNGSSVRREAGEGVFGYVQVELGAHALMLAEGAAVETYCLVGKVASGPRDDDEEMGDGFGADELDLPRAKSHRQVPYAVRAMVRA